ncbi:hypothetical protein [uncultured Roseobacter sp.]|uniref:hypothetical protein n=1 Tax=uncultured Roseobacter sp. TaxID=114847 RepID=UPI00260CA340|nr:hypothetical protein [uncultured Roseobacter sp.]
MQTISFLSPKGGAGRTTAVMALASVFVERKEFPPLVIDATSEERRNNGSKPTLDRWRRQMLRCGVLRDKLTVRQATSPQELTEIIETETGQRFPNFSTVLIDTGGRLDDLSLTAAVHSDLIIAPFMDALTAQRISEALDEVDLGETPLYGLKCGEVCNDAERRAVSAAFTAGRLLLHGIPLSPLLADISDGGHLLSMYIALTSDYAHYPLGDPGRAPVSDFIKVRTEINQLADEIYLALDGYELRRRTPMPRRNPLPMHRLAELLPT